MPCLQRSQLQETSSANARDRGRGRNGPTPPSQCATPGLALNLDTARMSVKNLHITSDRVISALPDAFGKPREGLGCQLARRDNRHWLNCSYTWQE